MPVGPIIILDKSTLQSLSINESALLENFFLTNITPLLYAETLADLEKKPNSHRTAEEMVAELSNKTPERNSYPNIYHRTLIANSLLGRHIEMANRPIIHGGQPRIAPDGKVGIHFNEFPEIRMMQHWYEGRFEDAERRIARRWRESLSNMEFDTNIGLTKNVIPQGRKFRSLEEIKAFVDDFIQQPGEEILHLALQLFGFPRDSYTRVIRSYEQARHTRFIEFAPYATYVFKVDLLFYIGILNDLISKERPSNWIDIAYLYYLPFCMVFSSNDKLHARTAPLFMEIGQTYIGGNELKQGLRELDCYYTEHLDEIESVGLMQFAPYPPSDMHNSVTRLWDVYLPGWRELNLEQRRENKLEDTSDIVTRLKRAQTQSIPLGIHVDSETADYSMISRMARVRKGKWRIMPPGVEDE